MASPLSIFRGALNRDISHAVGFSSWASPFIIFNTDATQTTDLPLDPISQVDGTAGATHAGNIRPVTVPAAYYYLNLFPAWSSNDAGTTTLTTAPAVYVFGLLPREQKQDRAYGQDISGGTNWPDLSGNSAGGRVWVPLLPEDGTSGAATTLEMGQDMNTLYSAKYMSAAKPVAFYLAGVRRIVVTVETAAAGAGNVDDVAIAGYFSG